jgi:hypothetical protein
MTPFNAVVVAWTLVISGPAAACQHLTQHFELCDEGTPWATGEWVNGGDSAALYVDDVQFEGFEDYASRDTSRPIAGDLRRILARHRDAIEARHGTDRFHTGTLRVVRSTDTRLEYDGSSELRVLMIGEAGGERLLMTVKARPDMALEEMDRLSRAWAGMIQPKTQQAGN